MSSKRKDRSMQRKCLMMLRDSSNFKLRKNKKERILKELFKRLCKSMKQTWASNKSSIAKRWNTNRPKLMSSKKISIRLWTETKCQWNRLRMIERKNLKTLKRKTKRMSLKLKIWHSRVKLNSSLCRTDFMISCKKMRKKRTNVENSTTLLKNKKLLSWDTGLKSMNWQSKFRRRTRPSEIESLRFII